MTDRHPDVVERRNRIARLREDLKAQYLADAQSIPANRGMAIDDAAASSAVEAAVGFDVELAGLQMGLQDRETRLEAAQSRVKVVEEDLAKHKALEANVFRYRKEYTLKAELLAQAQDEHNANIRRALDIASILEADESERGISFTVISPPTKSNTPVSPRGTTVLVFALLAGVAVGAVCVLLRELFDQTYHTTKQVTRSLGLALLESVDEIVTSVDRAKRFRRRVIYAPTAFLILVSFVSVSCAAAYLSLEQPKTFKRAMEKPLNLWHRISGENVIAEANNKPTTAVSAQAAETGEPFETQTEPTAPILAALNGEVGNVNR